jgi:hypothetical protein
MHKWKVAQQLYDILMKTAKAYKPKFAHSPEGTPYAKDYSAARTAGIAAYKDEPVYSMSTIEKSDRNKQKARQKRQEAKAIDPRTAR